MDCLGHTIDNRGIHMDIGKMNRIKEWRTPCTYNDVQHFLIVVTQESQLETILCGVDRYGAGASGAIQTVYSLSFHAREIYRIVQGANNAMIAISPLVKVM